MKKRTFLSRNSALILVGVLVTLLVVAATAYACGVAVTGQEWKQAYDAQREIVGAQEAELNNWRRAGQNLDENGVRTDRLRSLYTRSGSTWDAPDRFANDDEYRAYCRENYPEAVYPSNEWTVDEVLQSYEEQPEIWGLWVDDYMMTAYYFTFTPDYQYCFSLDLGYAYVTEDGERPELDSGWLSVNGVKVKAYDTAVGPVEPMTLVEAYQSGAWDGNRRLSPDWGTRAYMDTDGGLTYYYSAYRYGKAMDPEGLAYTGYAEPWWAAEELAPELAAVMVDTYYWPFVDENDSYAYGSVDVKLYPDLPVGYDTSGFFASRRRPEGTYFLSETGVILAKQGQIVTEWELAIDSQVAEFLMPPEGLGPEYANDLIDLYLGNRLVALRGDGTTATVVERIFEVEPNTNYRMWGFQGDQLICWVAERYFAIGEAPTLLGDGILRADFSRFRLVVKADGCYAIVRDYQQDPKYRLEYLGPEAPEYYEKQYDALYGARIYR